jgi:hypothetical protein
VASLRKKNKNYMALKIQCSGKYMGQSEKFRPNITRLRWAGHVTSRGKQGMNTEFFVAKLFA